jgi:Fe-S cluster biogenesis protein NfuA
MTEPDAIRIMASPTPNPHSFKFTVDRQVLDGSAYFDSVERAERSPLALRVFRLGGVTSLFVAGSMVTVGKRPEAEWSDLAYEIGTAIREHLASGEPAVEQTAQAEQPTSEVERQVLAVLDEIRPYVQRDGGDITFAGYDNGWVRVHLQGACSGCPSASMTLKEGVERRLREVIPDIRGVVPV